MFGYYTFELIVIDGGWRLLKDAVVTPLLGFVALLLLQQLVLLALLFLQQQSHVLQLALALAYAAGLELAVAAVGFEVFDTQEAAVVRLGVEEQCHLVEVVALAVKHSHYFGILGFHAVNAECHDLHAVLGLLQPPVDHRNLLVDVGNEACALC